MRVEGLIMIGQLALILAATSAFFGAIVVIHRSYKCYQRNRLWRSIQKNDWRKL
jgi:hypothetical protein